MSKKHCCLPPGALDELITRLEQVERQEAAVKESVDALEGAINAFIVVYGVRRLPDKPWGR